MWLLVVVEADEEHEVAHTEVYFTVYEYEIDAYRDGAYLADQYSVGRPYHNRIRHALLYGESRYKEAWRKKGKQETHEREIERRRGRGKSSRRSSKERSGRPAPGSWLRKVAEKPTEGQFSRTLSVQSYREAIQLFNREAYETRVGVKRIGVEQIGSVATQSWARSDLEQLGKGIPREFRRYSPQAQSDAEAAALSLALERSTRFERYRGERRDPNTGDWPPDSGTDEPIYWVRRWYRSPAPGFYEVLTNESMTGDLNEDEPVYIAVHKGSYEDVLDKGVPPIAVWKFDTLREFLQIGAPEMPADDVGGELLQWPRDLKPPTMIHKYTTYP